MPRDFGRIDEDAGADDPAHDQHGDIEQAEAPGESAGFDARFVHDALITSRIE
jgi:hypothetical protein